MATQRYAYFFSNAQRQAEEVVRNQNDMHSHDRLERFRWLLARYRHVWHFDPPRERFIELWRASETMESATAEGNRIAGVAV